MKNLSVKLAIKQFIDVQLRVFGKNIDSNYCHYRIQYMYKFFN